LHSASKPLKFRPKGGRCPVRWPHTIPGAISLSRELSLPGPWARYMAPTCTSRSQRTDRADGHGGTAPIYIYIVEIRPKNEKAMNSTKDKSAMRQTAKACRAEAALQLGEDGIKSFLETFAKNWGDIFGADSVVAGYWPMSGEMDVRPALVLLDRVGCLTALPEVVEKNRPLRFRAWVPGEDLIEGAHGTAHPLVSAPPMRPDVVLVPLLSFDRKGYRLGWGGGYYDRTLEALRKSGNVVAVGAAYGAQEVDEVPHDEFDQTLNWIITEKEAIKIK